MRADVGTSVQIRDDPACKPTGLDRLLGTPIDPDCIVRDGVAPSTPAPASKVDNTWVWWLVGGAAVGAALWYVGGRRRRRRA